eukprot:scaffold22113_cov17-Tisochrysis_lutea.AAC.1
MSADLAARRACGASQVRVLWRDSGHAPSVHLDLHHNGEALCLLGGEALASLLIREPLCTQLGLACVVFFLTSWPASQWWGALALPFRVVEGTQAKIRSFQSDETVAMAKTCDGNP